MMNEENIMFYVGCMTVALSMSFIGCGVFLMTYLIHFDVRSGISFVMLGGCIVASILIIRMLLKKLEKPAGDID